MAKTRMPGFESCPKFVSVCLPPERLKPCQNMSPREYYGGDDTFGSEACHEEQGYVDCGCG
ncbi:MAG TPA: hypothetical protein VNA10_06385, partial [Thermoplasmata archaeon]|nr:hypothetical protein [Thermoplasmata archaeon]